MRTNLPPEYHEVSRRRGFFKLEIGITGNLAIDFLFVRSRVISTLSQK